MYGYYLFSWFQLQIEISYLLNCIQAHITITPFSLVSSIYLFNSINPIISGCQLHPNHCYLSPNLHVEGGEKIAHKRIHFTVLTRVVIHIYSLYHCIYYYIYIVNNHGDFIIVRYLEMINYL